MGSSTAVSERQPDEPPPPVVLLLGPPGAGKGTQGARLAELSGLAHVSLGDELRAEIASGSELGERLRKPVEAGDLVPDALVSELALRHVDRHALAGRGVLLDGFPRTVGQAETFDRRRPGVVTLCLVFVVPRERLLERLLRRAGRDDARETIRKRLASYDRATRPLVERYAREGAARTWTATPRPNV